MLEAGGTQGEFLKLEYADGDKLYVPVHALDLMNSGQYEKRVASYWLPQMPDIVERLESGGRVLDVGCGVGRVATSIAKAYPKATVVGLDPDQPDQEATQHRTEVVARAADDDHDPD